MARGTIKRIIRDRGFGFILMEGNQEVFFHRTACTQTSFEDLSEGQSVDFDVEQQPKGPRAVNVRAA